MSPRRLLAAAFMPLLVAGGCAADPTRPEGEEEGYLHDLRAAVEPLRDDVEKYEETFIQTTNPQRWASRLREFRPVGVLRLVDLRLAEISPATRFFGDHTRLVGTVRQMIQVAGWATEMVEENELIPSAAEYARFISLYQRTLTELSGRVCRAAILTEAETELCNPEQILPGGVYGDRLHTILAELSADFTPRGSLFLARSFANPEVADYLRHVQPDIQMALSRTADELGRLIPPDEFAADHRVLVQYFDDLIRVSQSISDAAVNDPLRLRRLFPETERLVGRAREALSEAIRPAVAVWFYVPRSD